MRCPSSARCRRGCRSRRSHGLEWGDVGSLVVPASGIALIAFADTGILSRTFASRRGTTVDGSQEMVAIGVANIVDRAARWVPGVGIGVADTGRR